MTDDLGARRRTEPSGQVDDAGEEKPVGEAGSSVPGEGGSEGGVGPATAAREPTDASTPGGADVPAPRRRRTRSLRKPDGPSAPPPAALPTAPIPRSSGTAHGTDPERAAGDAAHDEPGVDPDAPTERLPVPALSPRRRGLLLAGAAAAAAALVALVTLAPVDQPADPAASAGGLPTVGTAVAPVADPAPTVPPVCAPVTLVTADDGPRSPLAGPSGELARLRPRLVAMDVPRPAPPADGGAWSRVVRSSLEATAQKCPATTFVVYGWSEGAAATTDALAGMSASPTVARIAGVALVGNPARDRARRSLPAGASGAGLTPSRPGALGALAAGTVEICAPDDPVCTASSPGGAAALAAALRAPAHRDYARLDTGVGDRTVGQWLVDAGRQAVDAAAPVAAAPGAPAPPPRGGLFGVAPAPVAGLGGAVTAIGLPVTDPAGLFWRAARGGGLGFATFKRNAFDEQSGNPVLVNGVRGGPALRFSVAPGGQRSEMQPNQQDPVEGQTQFIGYYGQLASDYPIQNRDYQIIMQWHHPGPNGSPPLTVEASNGELRLTGGERRPFIASIAPVRPGEALNLQLRVTFSSNPAVGAVSVWKDGQLVVNGVHPPEGTLYAGDDHAYMKLGMYRSREAPGTATVFVNDVLVGNSLESVSPARRGAAPR